eukprot:8991497-Pyramimonas_sp.AAC.2
MHLPSRPPGSQVLGVLDWELSTVGDPLADLAYNCLMYHLPTGPLLGLDPAGLPDGIPTESEYVAAYCHARGVRRIPTP